MTKCPKCGGTNVKKWEYEDSEFLMKVLGKDAYLCKECETAFRICSFCGRVWSIDADRCTNCGRKFRHI